MPEATEPRKHVDAMIRTVVRPYHQLYAVEVRPDGQIDEAALRDLLVDYLALPSTVTAVTLAPRTDIVTGAPELAIHHAAAPHLVLGTVQVF
jgi:hypothetical protein